MPRPWRALTGHGVPEAEGHGVPGVGVALGRVDLVDHHPHRPPRPLEHPGHGQVLVDESHGHVHHQQDHVGLGDGPFGLGADLGVERVVGGQPAAGVDHGEGPPAPLGVELLAVPGHPGPLLDHRGPPAHDAVDQGGLAHIGTAGDDHQGPLPAVVPVWSAPAHRGAPRVTGTRSVSAGRRGRSPGPVRLQGPAQREPVGGHHLDRPRQVGQRPGRRGTGPPTGRRRAGGSGGPRAGRRSTSVRSVPVSRPDTPMLPPKKWLATGTRRMSSRPSEPTRGPSTRAPYSPVRMAMGAPPDRGSPDHRPGTRGPVAGGRGPVDRGEEARAHPEGGPLVPAEGRLEGPGHAQAVLVLGEALVGGGGREGPLGHQVVLVGGEDHPPAEGGEEGLLPPLDGVAHRGRLVPGVGPHGALVGEAADAEGHAGHGGERRVAVEDAGQRVLQHRPVVLARAHHHLAVDLDAPVEQGAQPPEADRAPPVAQHLGPHVGIGGVDGDEEGAEPLGQDPLEVHLGEPGQGGEVPVEEGQPVVVVLQGEAAPHALGQLVDEAELAVVVAGADPVEDGGGDLGPERLPRLLGHRSGQRARPAATADHEVQIGLVDQQAVLDDVPG